MTPAPFALEAAAAEIEQHLHSGGWDRPPMLFALVRAADFVRDEPQTATRLGLDGAAGDALTPIEQEALPDGDLDAALARIGWPESVAGCALCQEILVLPPDADANLPAGSELSTAAAHPDRREARLVVAVLRDGTSASVLRLRDQDDDLLTGPDLAPNLAAALLATLQD